MLAYFILTVYISLRSYSMPDTKVNMQGITAVKSMEKVPDGVGCPGRHSIIQQKSVQGSYNSYDSRSKSLFDRIACFQIVANAINIDKLNDKKFKTRHVASLMPNLHLPSFVPKQNIIYFAPKSLKCSFKGISTAVVKISVQCMRLKKSIMCIYDPKNPNTLVNERYLEATYHQRYLVLFLKFQSIFQNFLF